MICTSSYAGTLLARSTAFTASQAETKTFGDGNLTTGVSPNAGGTVLFSGEKYLGLLHSSHDIQKASEAGTK